MEKMEIMESLRECLGKIAKRSFAEVDADAALELDSIKRISLVVELEWVFDIEIGDDELKPEVFDSLNSLASVISAKMRAEKMEGQGV